MGHLSQAELLNLVDGVEGPSEAFTSLLHLKRCPPCRARLISEYPTDGPALVHEFNLDNPRQPLPPVAANAPLWIVEEEPDAVIDRGLESWASASEAITEELLQAPALAKELEGIDLARQHLVLEARRFHTLGFAAYLLTASTGFWHEHPAEARRLADLALVVASKLDPTDYPLGFTADLRCTVSAYLGNALRLMGQLRKAEEKLTEALRCSATGTGDLLLRARILALLAQLQRDQRVFSKALATASEARKLYQRAGNRRKAAVVGAFYAAIMGESGDKAGAVKELRALVASVPRTVMGENTYWIARQNLCHSLVENDQLWEARSELHEVKQWARRVGKPLISARVMWVEAQLEAREGDSKAATLRLRRVRDVFLNFGLPYDAALACLDLAAVYLERGRLREAQGLACVLAPVFRASGIHREALASLRLLANALEKKAATASQVEVVHHCFARQQWREGDS